MTDINCLVKFVSSKFNVTFCFKTQLLFFGDLFRNMCDQQQIGKLNQDQFVMAMHLISQKVKGVELPNQVTSEMISAGGHDSGFGVSRICLV